MIRFCFAFFFLLSGLLSLQAQQGLSHVDYQPRYIIKQRNYILDKIEYYQDRTVVFFRFVCNNAIYNGATFSNPDGQYPWFLKDLAHNKEYALLEIKNIKRDNQLIVDKLQQKFLRVASLAQDGHTVFTCEIHFPALSPQTQEIDLIEGHGMEESNNFNCFNIKVKAKNSPELGDEALRNQTIYQFEKKFGIESSKPEIPPAPKPEVKTDSVKINNKDEIAELQKIEDLNCGQTLRLNKILFKDNSTDFQSTPEAEKDLYLLRDYLNKVPQARIYIVGHTDVFGNAEKNRELSKQRARKIRQYLADKGINFQRMEIEGLGSEKPLVAEGSPKNRRVEVSILCED